VGPVCQPEGERERVKRSAGCWAGEMMGRRMLKKKGEKIGGREKGGWAGQRGKK
jgi:hypothetical protein